MTAMTTIHAGHDVAYLTGGQHDGGCAGAMAYYTATGEPPGVWAGKGAAKLGLSGEVDPEVIGRLFMKGIGPGGEVLVKPRGGKKAAAREEAAVAAFLAAHPYASPVEVAEVRVTERGKDAKTVPYFDVTVDLVKSVSVLHASYRVSARQAREHDDAALAAALDAKADEIEQALMEAAREAVAWLEAHAAYTRTGHHSATTGEYRDGDGLAAAIFLHHISRDGDPHLHTHIAVMNRIQRADGADDKYRTLDSRTLHNQRLAAAAMVDRIMETKLSRLGHVMVAREDGNGAEVGGVGQDVMGEFSSRSRALTPQLQAMISQYVKAHGSRPSKRTIWLLGQQAAQNTRRSKAEARRRVAGRTGSEEPTDAERLAAWEAQTAQREVQTLSQVRRAEAEYAAECAARARNGEIPRYARLDDEAKRRAARIAVAEVQQHHAVWSMAQLWFEIHRALPVLPPHADVRALFSEVAELAVSGRAGAEVVCVTAPDITDVTSLGVRASDGGSIYRPPHEERYTTLAHLDAEEQILTAAKRDVPQLVTETRARAAVATVGEDLNPEQAAAVTMLLTAQTMATALVAPAGAGKSHTMAVFAGLWEHLAGRRVIGLATSTNAARVLAGEGLAESYNIAEFLGKTEGSDKLRRPVPLHCGDVLVIDEATQVSTADLAMLAEAARQAGARIVMVGDTSQLGAVDAGGMFRLLAGEVPAAGLHEVRRFTSQWEAGASVRLRAGDFTAVAAYDLHGRIRGADAEAARERAAGAWLADHLRGKDTLLLAGSNEEAADLARRVQARLIQHGTVTADGYQAQVPLADGNQAHPGDLIRARLNTSIDAGGQKLANRDTLKITAIRGDGAEVRRRQAGGTWTGPFWVPRSYLESSAELGYAGNVHVAQGATVDTAHLLVTETLSRQSLYVGMTRGREANTAHVVTGNTAPPGHEPYQQAAPEAVLKNVIERDDQDLSATEAIRQSQEWATGTGHLLHLWAAAVRPALRAEIDKQVTAALTPDQAARYQREHSRQALTAALRSARLAGHDISRVIGQITAAPLDGARSVSAVLHGRLQRLHLPQAAGQDMTWAQRTPASAPPIAREIAGALDARRPELGRRHADSPEPWLTRHLGILPAGASPALRADYEQRAGTAAAYREAAGITSPGQAVSPAPHRGNPELEHLRQEAIRALEIADEAAMWAGMDRGQLEARQAAAERAMAAAPPDVASQLRAAAHAEADALRQAASAQASGDHAVAASAAALAAQLAAQRQQLETRNSEYEQWAIQTHDIRENGGKAAGELNRRGHRAGTGQADTGTPQPGADPRPVSEWWRQFETDLASLERAIGRQHQAAIDAGQPWPPQRPAAGARNDPKPAPMQEWARQLEADAQATENAIETQRQAAIDAGRPWPPERQATETGRPEGGMAEWARQFNADMAAVERSVEREHQAAIEAGQQWPPRPQHEPGPGAAPSETSQWLRQFEADAQAAEGAIEAEHQAAINAGRPWPPERRAAETGRPEGGMAEWARQFEADAAGLERSIQAQRQAAADAGQPWPPQRPGAQAEPETEQENSPGPRRGTDDAARLDAAIARLDENLQRRAAENIQRENRSQYAARITREAEAQAEREAGLQAESPSEIDIEL